MMTGGEAVLGRNSFQHICRTCLVYKEDLLPIAKLTWEDISLKKVLQEWLSVEKELENILPSKMCKFCAKSIFTFFKFLEQCKTSYKILRTSLNQEAKIISSETIISSPIQNSHKKIKTNKHFTSKRSHQNSYSESDTDTDPPNDMSDDRYDLTDDDNTEVYLPEVHQTAETSINIDRTQKSSKSKKNSDFVNNIEALKSEIEEIRAQNIGKLQAQRRRVSNDGIPGIKDENTTISPTTGLCYICATCDKAFNSYEDLAVHKTISKHKASMYQCPYCTKRTNCYPRYIVHLRVHTGEKPNKCPQCDKGFNDKNDCLRHIKYVHQKITKYKCHICERGFKQRHYLTDHLRKHNNEKVICPYCGKDFTCMDQLYRHQRVHKQHKIKRRNLGRNEDSCGEEEQNSTDVKDEPSLLMKDQFKCEVCEKVLSTDQALRQHVLLHGPKNYACEICGKCFISDRRLEQHKDYAHKDSEPKEPAKRGPKPKNEDINPYAKGEFPCDICGKVLMFQQTLKAHRLLHGPKNHRCQICGKGFTTARRLKDHKDMAHEEGKYPCTKCDKVYKQRYIMERHMAKVHLGNATTFLCHACDKTFAYRQSLRDHLRLHNGDTQYQCKICFKICLKRRNLEEHMRMHTGEKPYSCPYCRKCFASKPNMATHMKQHTSKKNHVCGACAKGFYSESALKKHISTQHEKTKPLAEAKVFETKPYEDVKIFQFSESQVVAGTQFCEIRQNLPI